MSHETTSDDFIKSPSDKPHHRLFHLFPPQTQLTAVLDVTTREAVRKICRVFRELYASLVKENHVLKDKVGHLESKLRSKVQRNCGANKSGAQTVYRIKPSGQFHIETSHKSRTEPIMRAVNI